MRSIFLLLLCLGFVCYVSAQSDTIAATYIPDSTTIFTDTVIAGPQENYFSNLNKLLVENTFVNSKGRPEAVFVTKKKAVNKNFLFYAISLTVLFLALLKTFYARYFNNVFRVFFNTSLRQSQITDQLVQAKLPSLLFNLFFVITGGFYIYLLLAHLGHLDDLSNFKALLACIAVLAIIYSGKYVILKFTGWISGYAKEADTYIFIIFLINKIIAIVLLPVIIIMAFSEPSLARFIVILSYLIIMLMLVLRFFRSYSILQNRIQVQRFHFFLYIIGIEILPLLLIYKSTVNLLTNYL